MTFPVRFLDEIRARVALAVLRRLLGQIEPRLPGQLLHRVGEAHMARPHQKSDDIAMGSAAEAVKEALILVDGEAGRFLVMKRTKAGIFPAFAS